MKKKKELEKQLKEAQEEYSKAFHKGLDMKTVEEMEEYIQPLRDKVSYLDRELRFIQVPKYSIIPSYGDIFLIEDFIEMVKNGSLIDYDGHGNYADALRMTDIIVYPSDLKHNRIRKDFNRVVWFNR